MTSKQKFLKAIEKYKKIANLDVEVKETLTNIETEISKLSDESFEEILKEEIKILDEKDKKKDVFIKQKDYREINKEKEPLFSLMRRKKARKK